MVSTVKRIDDLIRVLAALRPRIAARLAVVGNIDPAYAAELQALAREAGVGDDVLITGLVPAAKYHDWVQLAEVVVQLRTRSVGEGSATVTDALAAGKAVVTNVGSSRELPTGTIARVATDAPVPDLARTIGGLLTDTDRRIALQQAALAHARTHSFADVARAVLDIATTVAEPAYPTPLAVPA